jgi:HAE1 family hydrophobic/amphiphilic exporter-1
MGVGGGMGGGSVRSRPVQIAVRGPVELDSLEAAADKIIERLRTVPGIRDAEKSLPPREPEMQILVDRQRAAQAGVSPTVVGQTIRYLVSGFTATTVDWSDRRLNVNVRLRPEDRADTSAILDLPVAGTGGQMFTMRSVATADRGTGPTVLDRQDRLRQISVGANLENRTAGAVVPDINAALEGIELPAGVTWKFAGEQAQTDTAFSSLIFALMLGLVFIYMVLASQFGSLIHPLTVMVALPLSIIGAVLAMLAARLELTVVAMIGIILLMGLVTKNSILLVDFIIRYRREGRSRHEAVITAGPVRLRPILMTTLAVLLGMIPTALGLGVAGAFRAPMAIAVLGGVISSTALSLLVVPVVYTLMDDGMLAVSRRLGLNGLMTSTSVTTGETGARNDGADTAGQGGKPRRDWRKPGTWFRSY